MALTPDEVLQQSKSAFGQWESVWRSNCAKNTIIYKRDGRSHRELLFSGAGKTLLCVANGPSLEHKIDIIKKYRKNVDIICVDKCLGSLIDNGVIPNYVILADAGIDYKKWMEPWKDKTQDIILLANINANPEFTENWLGKIIFYVNKDNIESEKIFCEISGCNDLIPASSNVGNASIVFATQVMGYDQYLLVGYDMSWRDTDNYYAFNDSDKRYWMNHIQAVGFDSNISNTSQNLYFSARWLTDFKNNMLNQFGINVVNCSGAGILEMPSADLEYKMQNAKQRKLNDYEKQRIFESRMLTKKINSSEQNAQDKLKSFLHNENICDVSLRYIPKEDITWINSL